MPRSRGGIGVRVGHAVLWLFLAELAGCGFRLAGSEPMPQLLRTPYLSLHDSYTEFARAFEQSLKDSGARLQPSDRGASATIEVTRDDVEQRVIAVSGRNIPTEYEITYTITLAVHAGGREVLSPQTLSLERDYSFDENALLAKEHEEDVLRADLARQLAVIATRRLSSLK